MSDLDHIQRTPLPWRTGAPLTECGLIDTPALTVDEFIVKARRLGQQRAALVTCMTCWQQVVTYGGSVRTGHDDLVSVLAREVGRIQRARGRTQRAALERELTAIAALIAEHRDEFDATLAGLDETTSLEDVRRRRQAGGAVAR
jgi:hypothetical protein